MFDVRGSMFDVEENPCSSAKSAVNDSVCAEASKPCIIFHHQRQMTRFALHRSNLFGSFPDLQSHRAQTKKHSIARWMTWPTPRIIFLNRWSPMRRCEIAKLKR